MARNSGRGAAAALATLLVKEGVLTQEQVNNCTRVTFDIAADSLPEICVHLWLEPDVFLNLLKGQADGGND